jgi:phosphatidylserine/phosphatidylglycerophosphate/cardiolipin synthase-like enzyme
MAIPARRRLPSSAVAVLAVAVLVAAAGACTMPSTRLSSGTATARPPVEGRTDTLITEPADGLAPIYRLLDAARHSVDLTMYELADPRAEALLDAAAARGVDVRVLLDRNQERARNTAAYDNLATHGVHVRWAPASYPATHEKMLAVDGRDAVIMTLNLTSEYYDDTRDFAVVDRDRRDVDAVATVFDADFAGRAPAPTPAGADLVWSPGAASRLLGLIAGARRSLLVENEEMGDPGIVAALAAAARRGVAVTVVMTDDGEYTAQLDRLAGAGVRVRVYADDASLYIHAKAIVADGRTAWVGSQNFSSVSLDHNRELGIVLSGRRLVAAVAATIRADAGRGRGI